MRRFAIAMTVIIATAGAVKTLRHHPAPPASSAPAHLVAAHTASAASAVDATRLPPPAPPVPASRLVDGSHPDPAAIVWRGEAFGAPGANVIHSPSEALAFLRRLRGSDLASYLPLMNGDTIETLPARDGRVMLAIVGESWWDLAIVDADGRFTISYEANRDTPRKQWLRDHAAEIAPSWDDRHREALGWVKRNYRSLRTSCLGRVPGDAIALSARRGDQGWVITGTETRSEYGASGWRLTLADDGSIVELTNWSACGGGRRTTVVRTPKAIN